MGLLRKNDGRQTKRERDRKIEREREIVKQTGRQRYIER